MKHICVGIVAHVDSGKTTLSENILYRTGSIRKLGRVDHGDTFLDNYGLERERGITIFSKQATFALGEKSYTLLDTPGHVDFSAEMERTLQVLDYAILVISGPSGVQGHTLTLWKLLERYNIPCFVFVNKMDQPGTDREAVLEELKSRLSELCVDMKSADADEIALLDEELMDYYLRKGIIEDEQIARIITERKLIPCYFGSALKDEGVEEFLREFEKYTDSRPYGEEFAGRIFKITRDSSGNRLTHMKITGGVLKVKETISTENWEEKVDQIRIYSGEKYITVPQAESGQVCVVTGLTMSRSGEAVGCEETALSPYLEPVLTYQIVLPQGTDPHVMLKKLRELEEEEPQLHIVWNESLAEIHVQVMGEVEIEILKNLIGERFNVEVEFGAGSIVYKETIEDMVEGVGHYEPLRHYAEVHLKLEPGEQGSGVQFFVECSEDKLSKNWQRLILTHMKEKNHKGVLTGADITDIKITLIAGKAHLKHTEGGDFRQATYRAIRHGLRMAKSVLLEPVYEFRLEVPQVSVGRALTDIQKMNGKSNLPDIQGDMSVITGTAPVATMSDYQKELVAYTGGRGKLFCVLKGYEPCHNADEVIEAAGYDADGDLDNPTGSVFCAHGAGFVVPWHEVENYMHIQTGLSVATDEGYGDESDGENDRRYSVSAVAYDPKELDEIFERTYGPVDRNKSIHYNRDYERLEAERERLRRAEERASETAVRMLQSRYEHVQKKKDKYLLVDGYNIIFAWSDLKELADTNLDAARSKLMDIMCNYQGYKDCTLIIVFDAYKVRGNRGEVQKYNNIYVIYTKEAETADQYIEKAVHEIGKKHDVTVATSDALEQMIIWGEGAKRMSANELRREIDGISEEISMQFLRNNREISKYPTIGDKFIKK